MCLHILQPTKKHRIAFNLEKRCGGVRGSHKLNACINISKVNFHLFWQKRKSLRIYGFIFTTFPTHTTNFFCVFCCCHQIFAIDQSSKMSSIASDLWLRGFQYVSLFLSSIVHRLPRWHSSLFSLLLTVTFMHTNILFIVFSFVL